MRGHGEKLTRKQEQAIACLLTTQTVAEAARACGVGEATMFRWLQQPEFVEQYRQFRRAILSDALSDLQTATREAVDTLRRLLTSGAPAVECRAAIAVLDIALRASEMQEMEQRLTRLEQGTDGCRSKRYA